MLRRGRSVAALAAAALLIASLAPRPAKGQDVAAAELTLERIMAHPDWLGRQPERPYWADDSASFYFHRKREGSEAFDLVHSDLRGETQSIVADSELARVDAAGRLWSSDRSHKVYARAGDVYVKDLASGEIRQLTRTAAQETALNFLTDGRVAFEREGQYFVRHLDSGLEWQPFDVRAENDPLAEKTKARREREYLEAQQSRLFATLREEERRSDEEEERRRAEQAADTARVDLPYYLGKERKISAMSLAPDTRHLLVSTVAAEPKDGRKGTMPRYVAGSGYVETEEVRARVGTGEEGGESLFLLRAADRATIELDLGVLPGIDEDPLAELRKAARRRQESRRAGDPAPGSPPVEAEEETEETGRKRPVRIGEIEWSDDGRRVVLQAFSLDNKDRWIASIDLDAGTLVARHRMHDEAWINRDFRDLGWLGDKRTIYFLSEETGYSQLHLLDLETGARRPLTSGRFVVDDPTLSADGRFLYYTANVEHPGRYEVYRVAVAGGAPQRITELGGRNTYRLSPDGASLLITHSSATRPPELYIQAARAGAPARRVTHTISDAFLDIEWEAPKIVEIPSSHVNRPIYSRLYLPRNAAPGPRPAALFVHGAGYLQNAHEGWSSYFREFMFHTLLTRRGYVVLDMDYRASAGYGRDWRTAIYRQMGTPEVQDLRDGVAWLVAELDVDPGRVGVYGGSYGGFLTFMALFRDPELFAAGAALRPVTDWAHYNHPYTSNILNTPDLDPEAYERSSPIEFAEGLAKPLLICTGMLDDNVFFQDSVRLVQRLIELGKEDWEIAIYPLEKHGFEEPASWLDEYRRILDLFETHLKR